MAIKIPEAPNIIGTQPVLRDTNGVNANFYAPKMQLDAKDAIQSVKDTGKAYAEYIAYNTDVWMNAACNQFTHDMIEEEVLLKDRNKGFQANDLYAKLENKAKTLLDDITGEPKDDNRVRISNPELQKKFRAWAGEQMPAYQSRMMNYSASELDKANTAELKRGMELTNNKVMQSSFLTADEELNSAYKDYVRIANLTARGMSNDYRAGEASRLMDDAVFAKMDMLAKSNIPEALNWYYNTNGVQNAMSSTSTKKFFKSVEDSYVDQGGSWLASQLAAGGSGLDAGGYLDPTILKAAFPTKSESEIAIISGKVKEKGKEIRDAYEKAQQGMLDSQLSAIQGAVVSIDISNPNQVINVAQQYANAGDNLEANEYVSSVQRALSDKKITDDYNKMFPLGDPLYMDQFEADLSGVLGKETTEAILNKTIQDAMPEITAEQADLLNRHAKMVDYNAQWINSPVYAEYLAKASSGAYHGEYVPELEGMPLELKNNLRQIVYYNGRYNDVLRSEPHIQEDILNRFSKDKTKMQSSIYFANIKRAVVKELDRRKQAGAMPARDSIEYNSIINTAVKNAESPTKARVETYLNQHAVDYLHTQGISPYLDPAGAVEELADVDSLPLNYQVQRSFNKRMNAETIVDAIFDTAPRTVVDRLKPYRAAMEKNIEETGNADVWFNYIDGIGQQ